MAGQREGCAAPAHKRQRAGDAVDGRRRRHNESVRRGQQHAANRHGDRDRPDADRARGRRGRHDRRLRRQHDFLLDGGHPGGFDHQPDSVSHRYRRGHRHRYKVAGDCRRQQPHGRAGRELRCNAGHERRIRNLSDRLVGQARRPRHPVRAFGDAGYLAGHARGQAGDGNACGECVLHGDAGRIYTSHSGQCIG